MDIDLEALNRMQALFDKEDEETVTIPKGQYEKDKRLLDSLLYFNENQTKLQRIETRIREELYCLANKPLLISRAWSLYPDNKIHRQAWMHTKCDNYNFIESLVKELDKKE